MLDALDAVTAERDALREQLAAHARHTDAPVDGVRVVLPAALAHARREGAEEMRRACVDACDRVQAELDRATLVLDRDVAYFNGRCFGAWRCGETLRALPLPGLPEPAAGAPVAGTGERASDPAGAPCAASSRDGGGGP